MTWRWSRGVVLVYRAASAREIAQAAGMDLVRHPVWGECARHEFGRSLLLPIVGSCSLLALGNFRSCDVVQRLTVDVKANPRTLKLRRRTEVPLTSLGAASLGEPDYADQTYEENSPHLFASDTCSVKL
jgi:hypothetical protein